jgi:hypothetical protein
VKHVVRAGKLGHLLVNVEAAKQLVVLVFGCAGVVVVGEHVEEERLAEAWRAHDEELLAILFEQRNKAGVVDEKLLLLANQLEVFLAIRKQRRGAGRQESQ